MPKKNISQIGLLGGTFDPFHDGHQAMADFCLKNLGFKKIIFIPCKQPSHRSAPQACAGDRLWMLYLSIANQKNKIVSTIEYNHPELKYTAQTLKAIRKQYPHESLNFILGMDSFNTLNQWEEYRSLLNYTHLIVINRPGYPLTTNPALEHLLENHLLKDGQHTNQTHGCIKLIQMPPQEVSATSIRNTLQSNRHHGLAVNHDVKTYIKTHQLYQTNLWNPHYE